MHSRDTPAVTEDELRDVARESPRRNVVGGPEGAIGTGRNDADDLIGRLIRARDRHRVSPAILENVGISEVLCARA